MTKICPECNIEFNPKNNQQIYCNTRCGYRARRARWSRVKALGLNNIERFIDIYKNSSENVLIELYELIKNQ